jgi:polar amino acid transport system substrate-binding protein
MKHRFLPITVWFLVLLFLVGLGGCGTKSKAVITTVAQANDAAYTIGVPSGATAVYAVESALPIAKMKYYNSLPDAYLAVQQGKVDAFAFDRSLLKFAIANGLTGVKVLDGTVGASDDVGIGISRKSKIPGLQAKINAFLAGLRKDGTLDGMFRRWVIEADDTMPGIKQPQHPTITLKVATSGTVQPFSYYKGSDLTGYDLELIRRLAFYLNAKTDLRIYDYDGFSAAAEAGTIDCILANLNATDERRQTMDFSDTLYKTETALLVRDRETIQSSRVPVETARLGVMVGSTNEPFAESHYSKANIQKFNNYVDSSAALSAGKLDYAMMDYTTALRFIHSNKNLEIASDFLTDEKVCLGVNKNNPELYKKVSATVDRLLADGSVNKIIAHWIRPDGSGYPSVEMPVKETAPAIKVAVISSREPTTFLLNGKYAGMDIELINKVLYELGYRAEYIDMEVAAIPAAIESGRADMTLGMYNTPERAKKILFTAPYFANPQVLLARKTTGTAEAVQGENYLNSLKQSFIRTFLTEKRWKLVLDGLKVTVLISICSGLIGALLGFGICMLRRSKKRFASLSAAAFIRLIQGTPIVVLLMILYYIIFGGLDISAILVAIFGFAVNFGVYVSEMMRTGIDAVDKGQIEAAHALGFTKVKTFWKITFPQAARHFLPVFKGEFISMVKMTSVVGYIAIQDLTKVSDIIRSRTLEAFFPLIATAVIYFLVANVLTILLSRLEIRLDPKRRKRAVKGVVMK